MSMWSALFPLYGDKEKNLVPYNQITTTKEGEKFIKYHTIIVLDSKTKDKIIHHYTCNAPDQETCKNKGIDYIWHYYLDEEREGNWYLAIPLKLLEKTHPNIAQASPEVLAITCEQFLAKIDHGKQLKDLKRQYNNKS